MDDATEKIKKPELKADKSTGFAEKSDLKLTTNFEKSAPSEDAEVMTTREEPSKLDLKSPLKLQVTTPGATVEVAAVSQRVLAKPKFENGTILSAIMVVSCLIGASAPLHFVLLASGLNTPYIPNSEGCLDLSLLLLAMIIGFWGFCTFRLARAFNYKSKWKRGLYLTCTILCSLINPAAVGVLMLLPSFAMLRLMPHQVGQFAFSNFLNSLGVDAHSALLIKIAIGAFLCCIWALPTVGAVWNYFFVRRLMNEVALGTNPSSGKSRLFAFIYPALQLLSNQILISACIALPSFLDPNIHSRFSYAFNALLFSVMFLSGMLIAIIAQGAGFYVLGWCVKGVDRLICSDKSSSRSK